MKTFVESLSESVLRERPQSTQEQNDELVVGALRDGLASLVGGTREELGALMHQYANSYKETGRSSIIGSGLKVSPPIAALVNAATGHALCFDDTSAAGMTHPTIVVLPAVLAAAEQIGATGREVVDSFAVGVEAAVRVAQILAPDHYLAGWHATSTTGGIGATAGVSKLLGLDLETTIHALNLSASEACGLRANFGSMTMIYHAGLASRAGVEAAFLASGGLTAGPDAFSGKQGFFAMYGRAPDIQSSAVRSLLDEPQAFVNPGLDVKPFPCGALSHRAIQAVLEAKRDHNFDGADVESIECRMPELHRGVLVHAHPNTVLEARISLVYPVAIAALRGSCRVEDFTLDVVTSSASRRMMSLVEVLPLEGVDYGDEPFSAPAVVTIRLKSGQVIENVVKDVKGTPTNPLTDAEFRAKWQDCVVPVLGLDMADDLFTAVTSLPESADLSSLTRILTGGRGCE